MRSKIQFVLMAAFALVLNNSAFAAACPICGKQNCPYAAITPSRLAQQTQAGKAMADIQAKIVEEVRKEVLSNITPSDDPETAKRQLEKAREDIIAKVKERIEQDPDYERLQGQALTERVAALPPASVAPVSPEKIDRGLSAQGYSEQQKKIFNNSGALGQLIFALGKTGEARSAPESLHSKLPARDAFDRNGGSGSGDKFAVAAKAYTEQLQVAAQKDARSRMSFEAIQQSFEGSGKRVQALGADSSQSQSKAALAKAAAIATQLNVEARERQRGLHTVAPPAPQSDPKKAESTTQQWMKDFIKNAEDGIKNIHNIYN